MKNKVSTTNYCTHAIEDLEKEAKLHADAAPLCSEANYRIIKLLKESVKFLLPDNGELIDVNQVNQAHLDLTRLPYPCVAFEAPYTKEDGIEYIGGIRQLQANKRIALCWEASEDSANPFEGILDYGPQGLGAEGIFVLPIYWGPAVGKWTTGLGGAFYPYKNRSENVDLENGPLASRMVYQALDEQGLVNKNGIKYRAEPFSIFPELYSHAIAKLGSVDKVNAQIMLDVRDELTMLIQACSVINCSNVTTAELPGPKLLNKKRKAKGKQPFFSYKVLQLTDDSYSSSGGTQNGTHSSPRMHLRRGHLRRLKNKTVWVRSSMINAKSKIGQVDKDYSVSVV